MKLKKHSRVFEAQQAPPFPEPAGLRRLENAFSISSFYSSYLTRWKADTGDFLKLLAKLNTLLGSLKDEAAKLEKLKDEFAAKAKAHTDLKKATMKKLTEALAKKEQSAKELQEAKDLEAGVEREVDQAESNVAQLQDAFNKAWAAYQAAKTLLEDTFKKGPPSSDHDPADVKSQKVELEASVEHRRVPL